MSKLELSKSQVLQRANCIVEIEIAGIKQLKQSLDDDFYEVCKLLLSFKGRVIVSGMGKSGHIGNKIAATLASTGTASFFVHPAEALHGDLGMITKADVVLAISNSGNTVELAGIIQYTKRFNIPLIAITSNKESDLGKAANYILCLPKAKEACPLGLAPTTSTTNTLIMGDALAITLLEIKGFNPEDFAVFHPGGSLGNKLLKVADIMHKKHDIPLISDHALMSEALIEITSHRFGCVGVVSKEGTMCGVITDGDIRKHMSNSLLSTKVTDVMTKKFLFIHQDDLSSHALRIMQESKVTNLFVLDNNKPVGIVHIHDLLSFGVV